jgi:hypothetical protein
LLGDRPGSRLSTVRSQALLAGANRGIAGGLARLTAANRHWLFTNDMMFLVYAVAFSPDGKTLAMGGACPRVEGGCFLKLWDVQKEKLHRELKPGNIMLGPYW